MGFFLVIIGVLGWAFSYLYDDPIILYGAVIFSFIYVFIQYFVADKLALAVNGAHEVTKRQEPRLYRTVENLSIATGMPMPRVYVMEDQALNAFATGRDPNHAVVCATRGLLNILDDTELEAVMAHELGHVKNYDIRLMMIVFGLVSAVGIIADILMRMMWFSDNRDRDRSPVLMLLGLVAVIVAPIVAVVVQMAVSRQREYLADGTGVLTTRYPEGLISALQKIGSAGSATRRQNTATAHLFFANPLRGGFSKWFSTHPPISDRVKRLQEMGTKL